jgi:hypothetical protein
MHDSKHIRSSVERIQRASGRIGLQIRSHQGSMRMMKLQPDLIQHTGHSPVDGSAVAARKMPKWQKPEKSPKTTRASCC